MTTYAYPHLGELPVTDVATEHLLAALQPIWTTKPETGARVRGRIEAVLDYARATGLRTGNNPARWRGHLSNTLTARGQVAPVQHHAALPWRDIGTFMVALRDQPGMGARAPAFTILTAACSGGVLGARLSEVDTEATLWTVPSTRMRAKREHRVPLTLAALPETSRAGLSVRRAPPVQLWRAARLGDRAGAGATLNAAGHHRLAAHYPGTTKGRHQEMPP